jgi:hypothetical protein
VSFVSVEEVRIALVAAAISEDRIQMAIDDAEDEALQFLNITGTSLADVLVGSESDGGNWKSIRRAVILLASIYIDPVKAGDIKTIRDAAERLLWPYRENLGV